MKLFLYIASVVIILAGGLFLLQGLSLVPSQVMYGKPEWVVIGAGMMAGGVVLALFVNKRAARN